ncbi:MAG: proteasome accessory factor PafA2 family protein, partial [Nitrospinales bacterium]
EDPWLQSLDLEYSNLDPERGLYRALEQEGGLLSFIDNGEVEKAMRRPPEGTRAMIRGNMVREHLDNIKNIHWTGIEFKNGEFFDLRNIITPMDLEQMLNSK